MTETVLYNLRKCRKSALCEHSLKWYWNNKWSSLKSFWVKKLLFTIKLALNTKYIFILDFIDIDDKTIEVIVAISGVIEWITKTQKQNRTVM